MTTLTGLAESLKLGLDHTDSPFRRCFIQFARFLQKENKSVCILLKLTILLDASHYRVTPQSVNEEKSDTARITISGVNI
jgi:hypothetical protein